MLARALVVTLGLLICPGAGASAQTSQDSVEQPQLFSLQRDVPPGSANTPFGLMPRDSYGSWYRAFATGSEAGMDVAQALFNHRVIYIRADVQLCPWGQYWTSTGERCVEIAPTSAQARE